MAKIIQATNKAFEQREQCLAEMSGLKAQVRPHSHAQLLHNTSVVQSGKPLLPLPFEWASQASDLAYAA